MDPLPAPASTPGSPAPATASRFCPTCQGRFPVDFRVCPQDATPLQDAQDTTEDPLLGVTLGEAFQIIRKIGEGGMACVYEARHVRLAGKSFAVKVLHPSFARDPQVVARFQREAEAASGIGHPNVVDVFDVHRTPDGTPYLVSEFLRGTDFADLLDDRGTIDVPLTIHVVRQVVRALAAAHAKGIVHRDVKPANVFLVGDAIWPVAKVLDFGISKVDQGSGGATLTKTGMIMGTPAYMPPEQARGARVDHRADIYGVGTILYRALTGRLPFDADDPSEALAAVLTLEPPRPRSINPGIPEALELVIERAMAKDPAERYGSMEELDVELEPFGSDGREVSMLPPEPGSVPARAPISTVTPTMVTTRATGSATARTAREARAARPLLVALSIGGYFWAAACLTDGGASLVALLARGDETSSSSQAWVVATIVVALSITPVVFWIRHLRGRVWANTSRSMESANLVRQTVLTAVTAYAVGALLVRVGSHLLPTWTPEPHVAALMLAVASLSSGGFVVLGQRRRPGTK